MKAPEITKNIQAVADFAEFQGGESQEFEFQETACVIPIQLNILLKTGGDDAKVGLEAVCDLTFNQFYPFNTLQLKLNIKGVDDQQKDEINNKVNESLNNQVIEKRETEDSEGFLFTFYENISDILTKYNDTCRGRCAVCLEKFSLKETEDEEEDEDYDDEEKFTERDDLVRIDTCYHRFHLICLYRDWFMPRKPEKDNFGGVVEYHLPEVKKCPICRRVVEEAEVDYIVQLAKAHPEYEDNGYNI